MKHPQDKSTEAIMDEAAEWVVRLGDAEAGVDEKRLFVEWLKRSPQHLDQYLRTERTWSGLTRVDAERSIDLAALAVARDVNIVELNDNIAQPNDAAKDRFRGSDLRSRPVPLAIAASILAAVVSLMVWLYLDQADLYTTATGEQRTVKLDDGSTVSLNTRTRLHIDFSHSQRNLQLLEGEALFKVAKDPGRPFRVISDGAIAQAVGTEFIVRKHSDRTQVTVIEGQVSVGGDPGAVSPSLLSAGQQVTVVPEMALHPTPVNLVTATAWQSRRLIFEGQTLAEAVAEFNRYNEIQLVMQDSSLSQERLSGVFDADQPQALVRFLERSGVIRPAKVSERSIFIISSSPR